jgi:hypothetical protein
VSTGVSTPINGSNTLADFHPMKGPFTTQTLRGLRNSGAMHWRGDRSTGFFGTDPFNENLSFINFVVAFQSLIGSVYQPSQGQMQTFADGFDKDVVWGLRDYTALCLMLDTGARVGEVCNLEPEDIYWDNLLVNLDGKTGKRLVPFGEMTERALRHWQALRTKYAHEKCKKVFITRYGGNCSPSKVGNVFSILLSAGCYALQRIRSGQPLCSCT